MWLTAAGQAQGAATRATSVGGGRRIRARATALPSPRTAPFPATESYGPPHSPRSLPFMRSQWHRGRRRQRLRDAPCAAPAVPPLPCPARRRRRRPCRVAASRAPAARRLHGRSRSARCSGPRRRQPAAAAAAAPCSRGRPRAARGRGHAGRPQRWRRGQQRQPRRRGRLRLHKGVRSPQERAPRQHPQGWRRDRRVPHPHRRRRPRDRVHGRRGGQLRILCVAVSGRGRCQGHRHSAHLGGQQGAPRHWGERAPGERGGRLLRRRASQGLLAPQRAAAAQA
jgi:hypothetical protein